jgi:hypothetical protein
MYSSASEATELSKYPAEVREYTEDIFIEKYPQVVSLHMLNAVNL